MQNPSRSASALLAAARARLGGVRREGLGEERHSRFRGHRIVRIGEAWHVGVLLLTDEHALATAEILRASDAPRRGYPAESARVRAERRSMALRGGFAEGEVAHVGWSVIDVAAVDGGGASGPLAVVDGVPSVAWSTSGAYMPLETYLNEQVGLLLSPPEPAAP